jgi:uncharacterized lipoprotein YajG
MKINFTIAFILLFVYGCSTQNSNDQITESHKEYISDVVKKDVMYVDSTSTTQEMFASITPESETVYLFIRKELQANLQKVCFKYKNRTVVISVTVKDSLIVESTGNVYEFNKEGDLVSHEDGAIELTELFINKNAKKFDFIDSYKLAYFGFRIESDKMCE